MRGEIGDRRSEIGDQRAEIRERRSETGDQRPEIRDRRPEIYVEGGCGSKRNCSGGQAGTPGAIETILTAWLSSYLLPRITRIHTKKNS